MTENSVFDNEKLLTKDELSKFNLPSELISILSKSSRYESLLFEPILKDVANLYIYLHTFYIFSDIEFSKHATVAIERANNVEKFYYYIKKIIEANVSLIHKDDSVVTLSMEQSKLDLLVNETQSNFIKVVDSMYLEKDVDLFKTGKTFAQVELLLKLVHNQFLSELLDSGKNVLNTYLNNQKEKEESNNNENSEEIIEDN